ncbi:MAG TPA: leucine-rich repeat domain-containing protein, partial [Mobilitalea sp.]|nr:leucine-rich repeat domain-containing protein [Mobilitalea sp.]
MKKNKALILILVITVIAAITTITSIYGSTILSSNEKIIFNNKKFEERVRGVLLKPTGDIYAKEVEKINVLGLNSCGLNDLSQLKWFKGLENLDLRSNPITDVSVLRNLKNLKMLDIESTNVSDISGLRYLQNLTYLSLKDTNVTDLSPLSKLKHLDTLFIGSLDKPVNDISAINS